MENNFVIWRMTGLKPLGTSPVNTLACTHPSSNFVKRGGCVCVCVCASMHMWCDILISSYIVKAGLWPLVELRVGGIWGGGCLHCSEQLMVLETFCLRCFPYHLQVWPNFFFCPILKTPFENLEIVAEISLGSSSLNVKCKCQALMKDRKTEGPPSNSTLNNMKSLEIMRSLSRTPESQDAR